MARRRYLRSGPCFSSKIHILASMRKIYRDISCNVRASLHFRDDSSISHGLREAEVAKDYAWRDFMYFSRRMDTSDHPYSVFKVYVAATNMNDKSQFGGKESKDGGEGMTETKAAEGKAPWESEGGKERKEEEEKEEGGAECAKVPQRVRDEDIDVCSVGVSSLAAVRKLCSISHSVSRCHCHLSCLLVSCVLLKSSFIMRQAESP